MPNFSRAAAAALLAAALPLAASACAPAGEDDGELVVLATFTVIADMAANVAGERARVESLTKPGAEVHGYEPTAADIARASSADLILDNGLGLEAWFDRFLDRVDAPHATLSDGIEPLLVEGSTVVNPHAWMSPVLAEEYVRAIERALTEADPGGAAEYRANADAYLSEIRAVAAELEEALASIPPGRRVLVTCEGAFGYLARDAGLAEVYLWPVNGEGQATPRSVAAALDAVRSSGVPAVFCESTVNDSSMRSVADESGASFGGTLYVDSISEEGGPVPTYLDLLRWNSGLIAAGLGARP